MFRILKKIIILLLVVSVTTASITSQAQDNSLLWRITGNDLAKPSFLFGTIHLICPGDYIWTDKMKASLNQSEKVCLELDLSDPSVTMQAAAGMIDNTNKKLEDYFTAEQYKLLARFIKDSLHLDPAVFEKVKPVMLEMMISTTKINCTDPVSYEDRIMKTAQAEGKKIMGLEDAGEQIAALEHMPVDTVIKDLLDDIQNTSKTDTGYDRLVAAYKMQDLPALYNLIINSPDLQSEEGILLYDRNRNWITRIIEKMTGTSVFFAVGAGHLYGPQGVIALLRTKGYTVEPIK